MGSFVDRIKDALFVTVLQALVVVILGVPFGYSMSFLFGLGASEVVVLSAVTGLFIANLLDIQEYGRVSP
ncbi:MAG: hypothetical protein ACR2OJ_05635 [Hyphomicrobiales bacterium]